MNIAELYSLTSGQKINKIHTVEKYFPLPFNNEYIVLTPYSKQSKNYSNWTEILSTIGPILEKNNIKIIQCGAKDEIPLPYCYHTMGQTNWGQLQYLISKSKLVLSTDTAAAHLAGHYDKLRVILISNNFSQCVSPFFGSPEKQIILEPDRTNKNPSFMLDEGPNKQIDEIKPEIIVQSVLKLLNINWQSEFKTLQIGPNYQNKFVEMLPDAPINIQAMGLPNIICRADLLFNEPVLFQQAQLGKISIITDRPINPELLKAVRPNILEIVYNVKEKPNIEFLKFLQAIKIPFRMFSYLSEEVLNSFKLDLLDLNVIIQKLYIKIPEKMDMNNISKYWIKSSKILLSKGLVFPSFYHYKMGVSIPNLDCSPVQLIDNNDLNTLFTESDFLYFMEKV